MKAFTLIEILLVITLLGVLSTITYVTLNPTQRLADARNSERATEVAEILNAVSQYASEPGLSLTGLGSIATCPSVSVIGTSGINLASTLVDKYIAEIPQDPSVGNAANTGYRICRTANGRVTVSAPNAENGQLIEAKR